MRQIVYTLDGPANGVPIPLDIHGRPEVSLQVDMNGAVPWGIEQTLDNPYTTPAPNILWLPHPDPNMYNQSGDRQGNYAYIPAAVRLIVTGTGTAKLTIVQAGITG